MIKIPIVPQIHLLDVLLIIGFALRLSDHQCFFYSFTFQLHFEYGPWSGSIFKSASYWERRKEKVWRAWSIREKTLTQYRDCDLWEAASQGLFTPLEGWYWEHRQKMPLCYGARLSLLIIQIHSLLRIYGRSNLWAFRQGKNTWEDKQWNGRIYFSFLFPFFHIPLCPKTSATISRAILRQFIHFVNEFVLCNQD